MKVLDRFWARVILVAVGGACLVVSIWVMHLLIAVAQPPVKPQAPPANTPTTKLKYGRSLMDQGYPAEASRVLQELYAGKNVSPIALQAMDSDAMCRFLLCKNEEAIHLARQVAEATPIHDPARARRWSLVAVFLRQSHRQHEATELLRQRLAAEPHLPDRQLLITKLMLTLNEQSAWRESVDTFYTYQKELGASDRYGFALHIAATALEKDGKAAEAKSFYRQFLKVDPDSVHAPEARAALRRLEGSR